MTTQVNVPDTLVPERHAGTLKPVTTSAASVHLDAVRGVAAIAVLVGHFRNLFFIDYWNLDHHGKLAKVFYLLTGMGHEAVMVFFVLSGYFITGSIVRALKTNRWSWRWYAEQRLTRLYVVLIPAVLLTAVFDVVGSKLLGTNNVYHGGGQYRAMLEHPVAFFDSWRNAVGNLLYVQNIKVATFGSNGSLWSLANEFWYYALFPLLLFAFMRQTRLAARVAYLAVALGICWFIGGECRLLFLVWLMGAAIALYPIKLARTPLTRSLFAASLLVAAGALIASRAHLIHNGVLADLISGVFVAISMVLLIGTQGDHKAVSPVYARVASYIAGTSYSLYLLHAPVLVFLCALIIGPGSRWQLGPMHLVEGLGILAAVLIYTHLVWSVTEAKTPLVRAMLTPKKARAAPK